MSVIDCDYTEDDLNKLEPHTRLTVSIQMIKNVKSNISQRADGLIIICELYQRLSDNQYNFSKSESSTMKKQITETIRWMMHNEKNCVVHHEIFYQIAARNMTDLVEDMAYCAINSKSIVSRHEAIENLGMMKSWKHISIIKDALEDSNPDFATISTLEKKFRAEPDLVLQVFARAIKETLQIRYPDYAEEIKDEITVRIKNFPLKNTVRQINSKSSGKFISVKAMLIRMSNVESIPTVATYECPDNHQTTVTAKKNYSIGIPIVCNNPNCKHREFELVQEKSTFKDYQIFQLQELPSELPPGKMPKTMGVFVSGDLTDSARMGDTVQISGIIRAELSNEIKLGTKVQTYRHRLYANNIKRLSNDNDFGGKIEQKDINMINSIKEISEDDATEQVINSFATHIHGHRLIKEALILTMIGSDAQILDDGTRVRGDINVFLVGDPGTAKSEMGKAVCRVAPRAFYASGRGSSGAGLTAATIQDKTTGAYMLEPGVTVLADEGLAVIDEFDKMKPEDRSALHEVMEQQCYDDQTEVLTDNGWKFFKDLKDDKVASLNNGAIIFEKPTAYFSTKYNGVMYHINSRQISLSVTPNHKMYVNVNKRANSWKGFNLIRMCDLTQKRMRFKKNAKWIGNNVHHYTIPPIIKKKNQHLSERTESIKIRMNDWLEFLGYYLTEGSTRKHKGIPYTVVLTQNESKTKQDMISCLKRLGFKPSISGSNINVYSKQFATHMSQFGYASDKYIPLEIKNLSSSQLRILFDSLILGDGYTTKKSKHVGFVTSSKRLADDFQELCLKLGMSANKYLKFTKGQIIRVPEGRTSIVSNDIYELSVISPKQCEPNINYSGHDNITKTQYQGKIYCVEVPNHVIYVRKNGKPVWCGNSVSISKGGITATLNARASIIAIANPSLGQYDPFKNITENIPAIPIPLLTRFDMIFVVRDIPHKEKDEKIARHMISTHKIATTVRERKSFDAEIFAKYLRVAKQKKPKLSVEAEEKIIQYYLKMRSSANEESGFAVTPRQLEGLIRLTSARAKFLLKDIADEYDADRAIHILEKMFESSGVDVNTGKVDLGVLQGKPKSQVSQMNLFQDMMKSLEGDSYSGVPEKEIIDEMAKSGKWDELQAKDFFRKMIKENFVFEIKPGRYSWIQ
jgi:replicative DNA helicase Mcm